MDLKRKLAGYALMPFMFLAFAKPAAAAIPANVASNSFYKDNPSMLQKYQETIGGTATTDTKPATRTIDQPAAPKPAAQIAKSENLNPELLNRFMGFRGFIKQKYGADLYINSGYRSSAEQAYLYRTLPRGQANPPGRSLHEKGLAIDYAPYSPQYNRHLSEFGLKLPFAGRENWHIEMV